MMSQDCIADYYDERYYGPVDGQVRWHLEAGRETARNVGLVGWNGRAYL
jgi:hypothetical protein